MKEIYLQIDKKIRESNRIAIFMHASPDGDTVWSAAAIYGIILNNFPDKKVDMINKDSCNLFYFLPNIDKIIDNYNIDNYDLVITVDMWVIKLCWFWDDRKTVFDNKTIINIDHHPNTFYWDINLVDITKPATTLVIYDLFEYIWYKMNNNIADCLLIWIYTDTWSFAYSNVDKYTFYTSSKLLWLGAKNTIIDKHYFSNLNFNFLKLYSLVLKRFTIINNFAISYLKNKDLENLWCWNNDVWSIVSRLNELDWIDYVLFLHEKWDIVKGSLRTNREDIDLADIAKIYNWWWHKKASAFKIDWTLFEEWWKIFVKTYNNEIIKFN